MKDGFIPTSSFPLGGEGAGGGNPFFRTLLAVWLAVAMAWLPAARAENLRPDTEESSRLTDYLHSHRLPLVGAQVLNSANGVRTVLLFGYTASDFGKSDAETKSRRFLKDADVIFNNHIAVRPELASMKAPSQSAASAAAPSAGTGEQAPPPSDLGDIQNYQNQQQNSAQQQYMNQQAQQYMNQGNSTAGLAGTLIPLLGMGLAIGLGGGSGIGMGVSPGLGGAFGGSPFGGSPGFGGSPFGGSPYGGGGSPYGGAGGYGNPSPYGPNPYGAPSGGANPYPYP